MDDWFSFSAQVVPMVWGDSTYTVLPIPDDITLELERQGARRVEVELNDHPFNMALTKSPAIEGTFVYTGKSVLTEAGITPGDEIDVRLRKADANQVDVPNDVLLAIRRAGLGAAWSALTPGKQRGVLHQINAAKRQATRDKRIAQMLDGLRGK